MLWIYVLLGTAGIVTLIPAILRAIDGVASEPVDDAIGFGATMFGLSGLALRPFPLGWIAVLICALALGFAVAAVHPEILKPLRARGAQPAPNSAQPAPDSALANDGE